MVTGYSLWAYYEMFKFSSLNMSAWGLPQAIAFNALHIKFLFESSYPKINIRVGFIHFEKAYITLCSYESSFLLSLVLTALISSFDFSFDSS
jgi:hypothetical protein